SRILAKSLNCTGPDGTGGVTAQPCGQCQACTEIDADRFMDYIELDAASNRGIDEARELIERAAYKPSVGRYKVFMVDEAHQLTKDAFSALLKTLEEPPEYLKFVLATTDPDKMLPTVLSRCLQFNLRPMAPQTVQEHLSRVLAAEQVEHDAGSVRLLSRAARGSMRDALSLTDQAIAFGAGRLQEAAVRAMLGSVERSIAAGFVQSLAARDGAAVLAGVDALRERGLSAAGTLEEIAMLLQQMAVAQAAPNALDADDPETPEATRLAVLLQPDETQLLYSIAVHGRAELQLLNDEYAALTMVLLRFLAFPSSGPPARASESAPRASPARGPAVTVSAAAPATSPAPSPSLPGASAEPPPWVDVQPPEEAIVTAAPAVATAPAVRAPPTLQPTELGDRWAALVQQMAQRGLIAALVRELAMQSQWIDESAGDTGALWRLRVERESLRTTALRDKLRAAVASVHGAPIELELLDGVPCDTPALREAAARARAQQQAEQTMTTDPVVRELMAQFKTARIVPGSIKPVQRNPSP
ncbi:MAG TPA: DNA polymerase III subunit gamma/tau, partial [Burkholderiaceae bacterium]|nr:DNA polymerase III subunit gamma/tau [Burkholderiaceae bacterium]